MTCTHQWHDATSSAGPEWVCAKCKITYTESRKAAPATKRQWVNLTDEQIHVLDPAPHCMFDQQRIDFARAIEAELKEKNDTN